MQITDHFYAEKIATAASGDLLFQVGHTENGRSISAAQFAAMVDDLRPLLNLEPQDRLLDLCCGNGAVTSVLAQEVETAVGVDLTEDLLAVARSQTDAAENTRYLQSDLRRLDGLSDLEEQPFTKVLLHAGLQHFNPKDLRPLLREILRRSSPDVVIVFGFIPEAGKQSALLNTPRKRLRNWYLRLRGRDAFGHWWSRPELEQACADLELGCSFHPVHDSLLASSHRMNMRIMRKRPDTETQHTGKV